MMSVKSTADQTLVDDVRVIANVESLAPRAVGPDVFRALAILLVMLWHLPRPATLESLVGLKQYAWAGVDIFFVLSGYLIGKQLLEPLAQGRPISLRDFYLKRAFRILPAFLVVLALYVYLPLLREAPEMKPAWRFLTFTMNFGLDYRVTGAFTQAWSLCVEEHFYLLLPMLVLLLSRLHRRGWVLLVIGTVLFGGMALRAVLWLAVASLPPDGARNSFGPPVATLSYSLYLTHKLASHANQWVFSREQLAGVSGVALYFASSFVAAALLWVVIERPFLRFRERFLSQRRARR